MKINLEKSAKNQLENIVSSNSNPKPFRIMVQNFSWRGPSFGLSRDEKQKEDTVVEVDGFTFLADSYVSEVLHEVNIEYSDKFFSKGFRIIPIS